MPVMRTPACTSMPRLRNDRSSTLPTSASVVAMMRGSASSTVTVAAHVGEHRRELHADHAAADDRDARRAPR